MSTKEWISFIAARRSSCEIGSCSVAGTHPTGSVDETLTEELRARVTEQIGAIARPDEIRFADNLPKTRSGKIMRRLLRTIASGKAITEDTSTLENEGILLQLQGKA